MKALASVLAVAAIPIGILTLANAQTGPQRPARPSPIRIGTGLASRIAAKDLRAAGGGNGSTFPTVEVTCRAATPHGRLAGKYNHICHESIATGIFDSYEYRMLVETHGRTYSVYRQLDLGEVDNTL